MDRLRLRAILAKDLPAEKVLAGRMTNVEHQLQVYCLRRFVDAIGDVDPTTITTPQVAEFLKDRALAMSHNASNKDRKNIEALFRWLQNYYSIVHDPTGSIRQKPHDRKPRRLIPIADILKVVMAAPMAERALIGAYWHTGARRGDLQVDSLTWVTAVPEDIEYKEGVGSRGTPGQPAGGFLFDLGRPEVV